jgi:hypothetical protein
MGVYSHASTSRDKREWCESQVGRKDWYHIL